MFKPVTLTLLLLLTPVEAADPAVRLLLSVPSARNVRIVSTTGAAVIPELQTHWAGLTEASQRPVREAIVRAVAAMPESPERAQFLEAVQKSTEAGATEILIAKHAGLLLAPGDEQLQDAFLADRWPAFGFAQFGERGFELLEVLLTRPKGHDAGTETGLARILSEEFPADGPHVVKENLRRHLVDPLTEQDEERLMRLAYQAEYFDDDAFKEQILAFVLQDPKTAEFGARGNLVDQFLQTFLTQFRNPSQASLEKVWSFYFNAETSNRDATETDGHFGDRRGRLVGFMMLAHAMQKRPETSALGAISELVGRNLVTIFSSDMLELRVGMERYVAEDAAAVSKISRLIASRNESLMCIGLDIIPRLDLRLLDSQRKDVTALKNWLRDATAYGFPRQPDAVRVRAIAALQHLEGAGDRLNLLEGLNSASVDVRVDTIAILNRTRVPSKDLIRPLANVLTRDPEPRVRLAVMQMIQDRVSEGDNGFHEGDLLMKALVTNSKVSHADVAKTAAETFTALLADNLVPEHVDLGLREGSPAIVDDCQARLDDLLRRRCYEFYSFLETYGAIPGPATSGREQALESARPGLVDAINYLNEGPDYKKAAPMQ